MKALQTGRGRATLISQRRRNGAQRMVVALDIGTTKTVALVGEVQGQGDVRIVGVGKVAARGMQAGNVVDLADVTETVCAAAMKAEEMSGVPVTEAYVGISGSHLTGVNSRGSTLVSRPMRGVSEEDVEHVLKSAQNIAVVANSEILHVIPRSYMLDGQAGSRNPLNVRGNELEVEAHLVTGSSSAIRNLEACVRDAGIEVAGMAPQSLAAGEAVLSDEERESGVVLIDIGGGTTDVAVFLDGSVWHSAVIPLGGYQVTKDLVTILQMPFHEAEQLKIRCGYAEPADVSEGELIEIVGFGDQPHREIPRLLLSQIIEARIEQICMKVAKEIKCTGYSGLLPAGAVLCGGTAELGGIRSVARRALGMPARVAGPQGLREGLKEVSNPAHACGVGLLKWALLYSQDGHSLDQGAEGSIWKKLIERILPG